MDSPAPTSKRKRSGKAREEAKARAIAAAEAAKLEPQPTEEGMDVDGEVREDGAGLGEVEGEGDVAEEEEEAVWKPDLEVLRKRIPQGLKSLHPILKRSKTSEIQRVIKKIKFLRGKVEGEHAAELADLEEQLESLKNLDLHAVIPPLLHLKLRKHPSLRPILPLPSDLFASLPTASIDATTAEGKAQNRVLSAKGVGEAVNGVVGWCIGVEGGKLKAGKGKAKEVKKGIEVASGSSRKEGQTPREQAQQIPKTSVRQPDEEDDDLATQDAAADAAGWESGSVGGSEESDHESGSDHDILGSESDNDDEPATKRPRTLESSFSPPPLKSNSKKADGSGSLFLPSLASGFTMGSYDSDPDEDEKRDKKSGKGGLIQSVRKNRRGQAERRKIWEQKYGKGANHVKKQQVETERAETDAKFLSSQMGGAAAKPKWGQRGDKRGNDKPSGGAVRDAGWQRAPPAAPAVAAKPPPKPASTVTGTEHPSWIAAKLRKEREMAAAPAAKPKKIVFD